MNKKIFFLLLLVFGSFYSISSIRALTYNEIVQSQKGRVLGDITSVYAYPSGSLVNDNGTIYFINGTTKIPFTNWQAFVGLGYSLRNVTNGDLSNYNPSTTYFITTANTEHPWGSWLLYNGTVYYSHVNGQVGVPSAEIFLQNGGDWKYVVKANQYDIDVLNSSLTLPLLSLNDERIYSQPTNLSLLPPSPHSPSTTTPPVACTMEAKLCPDGKTYVSRQAPSCEFAACPVVTSPATTTPPIITTPTSTPTIILGLTASQSDTIKKDLQTIKSLGFKRIRIITYIRYPNDSFYTTWPSSVFITFPKPKDSELTNLKQYLQLVDQAGLQYEFVLLMLDSKNKYYTNNITDQDYKNFVDAIWPTMWTGRLDSILVGGDMSLNPPTIDTQNPDAFPTGKNVVDSHRQWLLEMWPYMNAKCPGCNIGVELLTGYAKFWDAGASSLSWIKANLNPQPKFVGVQYYPTTPTALTNLGFKQATIINWDAAVKNWYDNLKAVAGGIPLLADEIGLDLNLGFTEQEQADFYRATVNYLVQNGIHFNAWEFADHPGIGLLGLMNKDRALRPAATAIQGLLTPTLNTTFTAGVQYNPPESVGWQFIMPQN